MKNSCLIIVLFFISFTTFSQGKWKQNYHRKSYYDTLPHYIHTIRLSPMSLVDFLQPSITIGSEWRFSKRLAVGLDISNLFTINSDNIKKWGFIIKPSFKYFVPGGNNIASNFFIEPDIFWKRELRSDIGWLGKGVENGVPAYFQYKNYTIIKDVLGANIKVGTQSTFRSKKMMAEFYVGIGVRKINKFIKDEPDAMIRDDRNQFFSTNAVWGGRSLGLTYWGVSFPMGIRLSYIIK